MRNLTADFLEENNLIDQSPVLQEENAQGDGYEQEETDPLQSKSFGTYLLPDGWLEAKRQSQDEKYFYIKETSLKDALPTNISVEAGTNRYSLDEQETFRQRIAAQLSMQAPDAESIDAYGVYTDNGDPLYVYTIHEEDATTVQYYIIGEKKHILIHLTVFDEEETEAAGEAAMYIANSFVWPE
jgi:hypothetical protein